MIYELAGWDRFSICLSHMLGCVLTVIMDPLMSLLLKEASKMYHFDFISVGIDVGAGADFS